MAITVRYDVNVPNSVPGRGRYREFLGNYSRTPKVITGQFDLDASYPTGGYDVSAVEPFVKPDLAGVLMFYVVPANGYQFSTDYTNKKLKVYQGDNTNAAAAPGIEVPNTTNLSALTGLRWFAICY